MKFSSTSPFKRANKRSKDNLGGVRLDRSFTSYEAAVMRAVPEHTLQRAHTDLDPSSSGRPKRFSLEISQEDVHPGTRVDVPAISSAPLRYGLESPTSPYFESAEEIHPDFLGVWNDGTVHWAEESEEMAAEVQSQRVASWFGLTAPPPRGSNARGLSMSLSRRSLRPKIRVSIPRLSQSRSTARRVSGLNVATRPPSTVPISTTVHAFVDSFETSNTCAIHSNPSQLTNTTSAVKEQDEQIFAMDATTPLAQQTFPTDSSENLPELSGSSISPSSDEHVDDDRSSVYSGRSSQSSISGATPDSKQKQLNSRNSMYSILTPSLAGVFDDISLPRAGSPAPRVSRPSRNQGGLVDTSNKPLPPEPLYMAPAPLTVAGRSCARNVPAASPSRSTRSNSPFEPAHEQSQSQALPVPTSAPRRIPNRQLRPKQSVAELDAIDLAFQRASPKIERTTLTEAEEALEQHLSTITEQPQRWADRQEELQLDWEDMPPLHSPLQIARGPMSMAPSRAPPVPPMYQHENMEIGDERNLRFTRAHMMPHRRLYCDDQPPPSIARRFSKRSRWSLRASRTLSQSLPETAVAEAYITEDDLSPGHFIPSPVMHRSLPTTPGSDLSTPGGCDPALLEVQKRLELVKMKERSDTFRLEAIRLADSAESYRRPVDEQAFINDNIPEHQAPSVIVRSHDTTGETTARQSQVDRESTRSLVAMTFTDIPELRIEDYSNGGPVDAEALAKAEKQRTISAQAAETVLLKVLWNLPNLKDLFSAAVVSRGFYRTFKMNELPLTKNALKGMSPAAWELREVSPPYPDGNDLDVDQPVPEYTPQSYLRFYTRDLYIMVALKSLMLVRCEDHLRPETITALAGNDDDRSLQIDDAFWRVWTFCKIFGSNKGRENDLAGQIDWLRGGTLARTQSVTSSTTPPTPMLGPNSALHNPPESFGLGNGEGGLETSQLWDMKEVWTCLRILIQGFNGRTDDAREFGIFDNQGVNDGDSKKEDQVLAEWIAHILTLGPSVILDLATPSDQPDAQGFALAQENGWTEWETPADGTTRTNFLEEAVTKLYDEKMAALRIPERSLFRQASHLKRQPTLLKPMAYSPSKAEPNPKSPQSTVIKPLESVTLRSIGHLIEPTPAPAPNPPFKFKRESQGLSKVKQTILSIEEKAVGAPPPKPSKTPITTILPRKISSASKRPDLFSPTTNKQGPLKLRTSMSQTGYPALSRKRSLLGRKTSIRSLRGANAVTDSAETTASTSTGSEKNSVKSADSSEDLTRDDEPVETIGIPYSQHPSNNASPEKKGKGKFKVAKLDDPVDRAVKAMVGLGFAKEAAIKALAVTDTGEELNVKAAVELCRMWAKGGEHR